MRSGTRVSTWGAAPDEAVKVIEGAVRAFARDGCYGAVALVERSDPAPRPCSRYTTASLVIRFTPRVRAGNQLGIAVLDAWIAVWCHEEGARLFCECHPSPFHSRAVALLDD